MGRFEFSWRLKLSYNKSQLHLIMLLRAIILTHSKYFFFKNSINILTEGVERKAKTMLK